MEVQILILVVSFLALLLLNVPVAIAIGLCTLILMMSMTGVDTTLVMAQRMSSANSSFTLLAIPFFITACGNMFVCGLQRRQNVDCIGYEEHVAIFLGNADRVVSYYVLASNYDVAPTIAGSGLAHRPLPRSNRMVTK